MPGYDERRPEQLEFDQWRWRATLVRDERDEQDDRRDEHRDDSRRRPAIELATLGHGEEQQDDRGGFVDQWRVTLAPACEAATGRGAGEPESGHGGQRAVDIEQGRIHEHTER